MKVIVHRQALVEVLGLACSVVLTRSPKPVLSCVRISTATVGGSRVLRIVATDLEITIETSLSQVDIKQDGIALLPAHKLLDIVNNSPDENLALDVVGEKATILGADSMFTLLGFNSEDFPPVSGFEGAPDCTLSAGLLKTMLDRTRFAAAKEMTRYAMNGVLFERKGKKLSMVATDGHRLAQARDEIELADERESESIIPIKAINMLERLLVDPEQTVQLQFREGKLFAQLISKAAGEKTPSAEGLITASLSASLVEGNFPPYKDVIPKDCDHKASINRDKFRSAVQRAALLTNEESKSIRLSFGNKNLTITGRAPEMGEAKVEMPIDYTSETMDVGFNPIYLQDALKVAPTEEITFELRAPNKPGLIKSGQGFLYVIMPVSLP